MTHIEDLAEHFNATVEEARAAEEKVWQAALVYIAACAVDTAPDPVYMLMETSDQGRYMCPPSYLTDAIGHHLNEEEWDELVETDDDLNAAASWLGWEGDWQQYVDDEHPYTNHHGGYYAVDLRKIAVDFPQIKPAT